LYRIWFRRRERVWCEEKVLGRFETSGWLLVPTLATAAFALIAGVLAGMPFSPLYWADLIVSREYLQ
jgi:multicomponent Na+:H+ antiporter subunit D